MRREAGTVQDNYVIFGGMPDTPAGIQALQEMIGMPDLHKHHGPHIDGLLEHWEPHGLRSASGASGEMFSNWVSNCSSLAFSGSI